MTTPVPKANRRRRPGPILLAAAMLAAACTGTPDSLPSIQGSPGGPSSPATQVPSSSEPPAATDLHGLIAYSTEAGDIWVMNADGSDRRQVTHAGGHDFDPSLSPDGTRIVFRTSRGTYERDSTGTGLEGIFVVDVDGSNEHEIQPPRGGLFPDWSPDGKRIALSTVRPDQTETIVTMNPDGTHVHDTGLPGGECSEWSPDSSKIAYCQHPSGGGLFDVRVMDVDGGHRHQLTDAIGLLLDTEAVFGRVFTHGRYDIGQKLDFLRANIEIALDRPDLGPDLADYLRALVRDRLS